MQVVNVNAILDRLEPELISRAMHMTTARTTAC